MNSPLVGEFTRAAGSASDAAQFLSLMANEKRLLLLCHLQVTGECDAKSLAVAVALSPQALSQHLARLREAGLVEFRREAQTLFYRLNDPRAVEVMGVLKAIFCPPRA